MAPRRRCVLLMALTCARALGALTLALSRRIGRASPGGAVAGAPAQPACARHASADACRRPAPARWSGSSSCASSRSTIDHRAADLPLLHPDPVEPPQRRRVGAVSTRRPSSRCSRTSSGCGRPTSSTTCGLKSRRSRTRTAWSASTSSTTWKSGRASRSSTTPAPSKVERTKIDEKMKEAEHRAAPRLVPRSGRRPARRGHRRVDDGGEGLPVRRGQVARRGAARRPEAGEGRLRHQRRPKVKVRDIDFIGNAGDQRRRAQAQDEGDQGALVPLVDHRPRHLPGSQVRRRRREGRRVLPRTRATSRRASGSRRSRRSRTPKTRRRAGSQLRIPVTEGPALPRRRVRVRRQQGHQDASSCSRCSS